MENSILEGSFSAVNLRHQAIGTTAVKILGALVAGEGPQTTIRRSSHHTPDPKPCVRQV